MRLLRPSTAKDSKHIQYSFILLENFMFCNIMYLGVQNPGKGNINSRSKRYDILPSQKTQLKKPKEREKKHSVFRIILTLHKCSAASRCFNLKAPRFFYIGQAFRCSPENAFYIFNQQIYFII